MNLLFKSLLYRRKQTSSKALHVTNERSGNESSQEQSGQIIDSNGFCVTEVEKNASKSVNLIANTESLAQEKAVKVDKLNVNNEKRTQQILDGLYRATVAARDSEALNNDE